MPFMFDGTYFLLIIGLVISLAAQAYVKSTFSKFSEVASRKGYTATQAAQYILDQSGIRDVRVERVRGDLTDHYDAFVGFHSKFDICCCYRGCGP